LIKKTPCSEKQINVVKNHIVDNLAKWRKRKGKLGPVSRQPNKVDLGAARSSPQPPSKDLAFPLVRKCLFSQTKAFKYRKKTVKQ
jgi:hypothetical protein